MKEIKTTADITNATAIDLGPLAEIKDYVLELGPDVKIPGKVFGGNCSQGWRRGLLAASVRPRHGGRILPYAQGTRRAVLLPFRRGRISGRWHEHPRQRGFSRACLSRRQARRPQHGFDTAHNALRSVQGSRAGQRHASRRNDSRRSGKVVVESDKGKGTKEVRS